MMKIKRFVGGNLEANGYVIYHRSSKECFIIDPGYNANRYIEFAKSMSFNVKGILLTHHHHDHVGAVEKIRGDLRCSVYMHRQDMVKYKGHIDVPLDDGDTLLLDEEKIQVLHTPGHTLGGVCFYAEESKVAFTGDTIFNVDIGRTDFSDGDPYKMQDSMNNVINKWTNDITIYPGHGDPATMKFVRENNREFIEALI